MSDDSSQEEKQNFLRENILDKGYDTNMFVDFLMGKKGEEGADIGNWSMNDLKIVVQEFISMQSKNYNPEAPQPEVQPVLTNNPIPTSVKDDPLSITPKISISNDPLQVSKTKIQNDPLQNKQFPPKKQVKYDPLSGGISQAKEEKKK